MSRRSRYCRQAALVAGIAGLFPGPAAAETVASVFGRWLTDDRAAIVRIERCGEKLCGRIERVLDARAPHNDANNPDRAKRGEPLVGTMVLRHFTGSGPIWLGGEAYDPKTGRSYRSQLRLLGDGSLKVTGCVLFICRSRHWSRAG